MVAGIALIAQNSDQDNQQQGSEMTQESQYVQSSRTAIERQNQDNVYVIDVRTTQEWDQSHAVGAIHWGLEEELLQGNMPDVPLDSEIYVYCRSGNRAGQAIALMRNAGFTNLTNTGGLADWQAAGGQVE